MSSIVVLNFGVIVLEQTGSFWSLRKLNFGLDFPVVITGMANKTGTDLQHELGIVNGRTVDEEPIPISLVLS